MYDDALAKRNGRILAFSMALAGANAAVIIATGGLVGLMLAPSPAWATLPITAFVLGTALTTVPAARLMARIGRRAAYELGAGVGVLAGLLAALSIRLGSFSGFLMAAALCGVYQAFVYSYRFAAADTASPAYRPRVISLVMAGGVAAAFVGPQLVIHTRELFSPFTFAATFLGQAAIALVALLVLRGLNAPAPPPPAAGPVRPLRTILSNPRLVVAMACGASAQALMNLVMTGTPIAMIACNHPVGDAALAIQWHILAMFAPGFFTGHLIARFGKERVAAVGLTLMAGCGIVALSGISVTHFWAALVLLGLGWSFAYISASAMVTDCHRPEERGRVQGLNDLVVFSLTAVASLASGTLLDAYGWDALNWLLFPVVALCLALLGWLMAQPRLQPAA